MADISAPPLAAPPLVADGAQNGALAIIPASAVPPIPGQQPVAPEQPEFVSETLYIQNLNEKIKIPVMKASLRGLFKSYGEVLDVVAHSNLRMRGQAFVSFESADIAKKALKDVRGFPLYSKPMVSFNSSLLCDCISCYAHCWIYCDD
jgi:U2 small nuclear ribonucleoprotein B''